MDWEFDDLASTTYPLYSRAVVGDLCPDPVTPLTATAGVGAELGPAWGEMYARTGLRPVPDGRSGPVRHPVAMFGAYLYLNTSLLRLFGVYASGADPMAFARQYLGERPDVPRQRDERPALDATAERLEQWTASVLTETTVRSEYPRAARRLAELRTGQPDPAASTDAALAARILGLREELREALRLYVQAELATSVATDLLTRTTEEAGHPGLTGELVSGAGGSVCEPVERVWRLAAQVGSSERFARLFDQGVAGVSARIQAAEGNDLGRLRTAVRALATAHGHVGPAEWELAGETWGTDPLLPLTVIDVLRRADAEPDPTTRARLRANLSAQRTATVRASLRRTPAALERFDTALSASARWLLARQNIRQIVSALHHEQRKAARELGQRQVNAGLLDSVDQVFMLLAAELPEFTSEPSRLAESLRMRAYDYHALGTYSPPFVTIGQPPPVVRWSRASGRAPAGRRNLSGTPASAGIATGPASVLAGPGSGAGASAGPRGGPTADSFAALTGSIRPGEVLVVPAAGPSLVPFLALASAVVVDAGAALSDLAVACRDLAVPCVVATVDATSRISQGSQLEVDGFAGVVRLLGRGGDGAQPTDQPGPFDQRHSWDERGGSAGPTVVPLLRDQPTSNPA